MWQRLMILAICLWPGVLFSGPLETAERAILAGSPQTAITSLTRFQPQTKAELIRQLWALGLAYNKAGRSYSAIAPLSRLVTLAPATAKFRLELAATLARNGQTERALYHFELAKGAGLPPPVQAKVQAEIDRIEQSKNWQGYFRFAFIPESNAARRTAAETVTLGGLLFGINPSARAQAATGIELGFGLAARPRLSETLRARIGLDVLARVFDGAVPEDVILRANAALLAFGDYGAQTTGEVFATRRLLDKVEYSASHGIGLAYSRALGTRARLSLAAEYEAIEYRQSPVSVHRKALNAHLSYAVSPQFIFRVAARLEGRDSKSSTLAGAAAGLTIGGDYAFTGGLRIGLDLSYDRNIFDGPHPLFGVVRKDEKLMANLQFTNQNWSYRGFAPVLKLGMERQRSSIVLNRYNNLSASLGITRSF